MSETRYAGIKRIAELEMINPLCGTFFLGSLLWMIFGAMIIPEEKLEKKKMAFSLSIIWALFALIVK